MKIYFLVILLASSNAIATISQTFVCDMRDLRVNDVTTGSIRLQVSETEAVLNAGIWGDTEVATLFVVNSASNSSVLFLHNDEKGRIEQSFDILPPGEAGIFIWRNYDWQNPDSRIPISTSIHICNKK